MTMTDEEYLKEIDPEYLLGKIDMLQHLVAELIYQMPERTMKVVESHANYFAQGLQTEAQKTGNMSRQKYSAGAWEVLDSFSDNIDWIIDEVQNGDRIRTVQPAPVAEENWIDPRRKF